MNAKWKQAWAIVLSITLIAILVACGNEPSGEMESNNPVAPSEQPTDNNQVTNSPEDHINTISLYKTINKFSSDGTLQETIDCIYDERALTLTCTASQSGNSYIFEYNAFGEIVDEKTLNSNGVLVKRQSYDRDGKRTVDLQYNDDGTLYMGYQWQYDELGNRIKCTNQSSDGSYYEDEYDRNGNEIKSTYYSSDGAVQRYTLYDYEYDSNGKTIEKNITYSDGRSNRIEYKYDATGNVIRETTYSDDGDVSEWYEYEYDSDGNKIRSSYYSKYSGEDLCTHKHTYAWEYDSMGHIIREAHYTSDKIISYEEEHDSEGRLIKSLYYNSDGSLDSGHIYKYNTKGAVAQFSSYTDGKINYGQTYEYEYDSRGEVSFMRLKDSITGSSLGEFEYTYDTEGNMLSCTACVGKENIVAVDFQTIFFKSDPDYPPHNNSIQYTQLPFSDTI